MKSETEEFIRLLREYWELSESCYERILSFMQMEDYESKGRIPNTNFSYEHHGSGYSIQLDSGIGFDFDFYIKKLAGIFPYFLIGNPINLFEYQTLIFILVIQWGMKSNVI